MVQKKATVESAALAGSPSVAAPTTACGDQGMNRSFGAKGAAYATLTVGYA